MNYKVDAEKLHQLPDEPGRAYAIEQALNEAEQRGHERGCEEGREIAEDVAYYQEDGK